MSFDLAAFAAVAFFVTANLWCVYKAFAPVPA